MESNPKAANDLRCCIELGPEGGLSCLEVLWRPSSGRESCSFARGSRTAVRLEGRFWKWESLTRAKVRNSMYTPETLGSPARRKVTGNLKVAVIQESHTQ